MKIVGYNCRGLGNRPAVRGLLALQKKEDPDILFLSETKLDKKGIEKFRHILGMPHLVFKECHKRVYIGLRILHWKSATYRISHL
jgi:exonuclease III